MQVSNNDVVLKTNNFLETDAGLAKAGSAMEASQMAATIALHHLASDRSYNLLLPAEVKSQELHE